MSYTMFWLKFRKCIVLNRNEHDKESKARSKPISRMIPTFFITFVYLSISYINVISSPTNLSLMNPDWSYDKIVSKTFLILLAMHEEAILYVTFNNVIGLQL